MFAKSYHSTFFSFCALCALSCFDVVRSFCIRNCHRQLLFFLCLCFIFARYSIILFKTRRFHYIMNANFAYSSTSQNKQTPGLVIAIALPSVKLSIFTCAIKSRWNYYICICLLNRAIHIQLTCSTAFRFKGDFFSYSTKLIGWFNLWLYVFIFYLILCSLKHLVIKLKNNFWLHYSKTMKKKY